MKFGNLFENQKLDEYRHLYCDYKGLKKLIKLIQKSKNEPKLEVGSTPNLVEMLSAPYHAIADSKKSLVVNDKNTEQPRTPVSSASASTPTPTTNIQDEFVRGFEQEVVKVNGFYSTKFNEIETRLVGAFSALMEVVQKFKEAKKSNVELTDQQLEQLVNIYRRELAECEHDCTAATNLFKFAQQNVEAFRKIAKKYNKHVRSGALSYLSMIVEKHPFYSANMDGLLTAISDVYRVINWIERKKLTTLRRFLSQGELEHLESNLMPSEIAAAEEAEQQKLLEAAGGEKKKKGEWVPPESFKRRTEKYWVDSEAIINVKVLLAKRIPILIFGKDAKKEDKKRMKKFGMRLKPVWENLNQTQSAGADEASERIKWKVSSLVSSVYYDNEDHDIYRERITKIHNATLLRTRWYGKVETTRNIFMERKIHKDKKLSNEESIKERFEMPLSQLQAFCLGNWNLDREDLEKKMSKSKADYAINLSQDIQHFFVDRKLLPTVRTMYMRTAFQSQHSNDFRATFDTHLCFCKEYRDVTHDPPYKPLHDENFDARNEVHMFPKAILELKYAMSDNAPLQWVVELLSLPGVTTTQTRFSKFIHGSAICYPEVLRIKEPQWFTMNENAQEATSNPSITHVGSTAGNNLTHVVDDGHGVQLGYQASAAGSGSGSAIPASAITLRSVPAMNKGKKSDNDADDAADDSMTKGWMKTTMVNERTLLNWVNHVVLLLTASVTLMGFGDNTMQAIGAFISVISILFSLYALFKFFKRRSVIGAKGGFGIDDWIGPSVLVMLLMATMATSVIVTFIANSALFKFETVPLKDKLLDSKDFQVYLPYSSFYGKTREFAWQSFLSRISTLEENVQYRVDTGVSPYVRREYVAFFVNKQANNVQKTHRNTMLKAREYLTFKSNSTSFIRDDKTVEVLLKYYDVNIETFVPPRIDFRAPYVHDREVRLEEEIACNYTTNSDANHPLSSTRVYSHSSKVVLKVPNSYKLSEDSIADFLAYFIDTGYTKEDVVKVDHVYNYLLYVPIQLNNQNITNPNMSFKYNSQTELLQGISSYTSNDGISFSFKLERDLFATTNRYANHLHKQICALAKV